MHQHINQVFEEVGLIGAEQASRDLVHGLLQLRDTVVVGHSVISGTKHIT